MHKQNKTIQWNQKPNKTAQHTTKMSLRNTVERWRERRVTMQALPRHRAMASLPKRCLEVEEGSGKPERSPIARPMAATVRIVSSPRPPRVSATRGMKSVPVERQTDRWADNLRRTPTCRAWPGVCEASTIVCCWRGLITCTSKAAGRPLLQLGRRTSAGRDRELGTMPGDSLEGARAAD